MEKQWKDIKNSYFQKNVFRQLKRKQEFLWRKLLKREASPQSWKKRQQFIQNQKLKIAIKKFENKRWKINKSCQKQETIVEKRKNF